MRKLSPINTFSEGDKVQGFYLCVEKHLKYKRNGDVYIDLELRDITGFITAKIWDNVSILNKKFDLLETSWDHQELSTPRSFERWTGRPGGIVGGLGQHPDQFGPFGLSSRTPLKGLWLCGESIYPGEGTAGVSQSAMMVVRQLMKVKGRHLNIPVFN